MSDEEVLDQVPVDDAPPPRAADPGEPSAEELVALRRRDPLRPVPPLVGVAAG